MAKREPSPEAKAALAEANAAAQKAKAATAPDPLADAVKSGFNENAAATKTTLNPPIVDEKAAEKAALAQAKADEKARKEAEKKAKADQKAADAAAKIAGREAKEKERADAKAAREARMAALAQGHNYTGPMLALADAVKSGKYVKGLNGQLRSENPLAVALDGVQPSDVVRIGLDLLKLEVNPYAALNMGQQSMNLRNKLRGAIKKEAISLTDVNDYIARNKINRITPESVAAAAQAVADKKEAKAKELFEKAEAKLKAKREKEEADAKAKVEKADSAKPEAAPEPAAA